jgi:outer membrane protein OmpA-like peptidoglycan-associated protein
MKMKKAILSCLMLLAGLTASAQEQKGTTEYVFEPHWYVNIQPLGIQYTLGEVDFGDLLSYNIQAAAGYEFNKVIGARLAINAWQSKAGLKFYPNTGDNSLDALKGDYKWKWNYIAPTVDITFNLSNLISGVNPKRVFSVGAFAGIGANIAWGNSEAADVNAKLKPALGYNDYEITPNADPAVAGKITSQPVAGQDPLAYLWDGTKTRFVIQAGLTGDIKINDQFAVTLEVSANTLNDKYNSKKAKNWDWYFNALAGLKINFGPTYSTKFIPAPEPEIRYVEKIVEKIVEVPAAPVAVEPIRRDIFFLINKAVIRDTEASKVNDIVAYLNENKDAKVQVTGYADAGTGNDKINDRLAAQRADAVVKALKDAGIAADRITFDSKGARVQPFADNDSNRVSIVIAE